MFEGVYVRGGVCPGGKCQGGKCPRGICPRGKCPGGTCPGGGGGEGFVLSQTSLHKLLQTTSNLFTALPPACLKGTNAK